MDEILDDDFPKVETSFSFKRKKRIKTLTIILILGCIISPLIALKNIESIVITGPFFSIVGLLHFYFILHYQKGIFYFWGLVPLIISIICFILVNYNNWSPSQAYSPISTILIICGCILFFIYVSIYRKINSLQGTNY